MVDLTAKLFILGDFNIQIDRVNSEFVAFMENCQALCDSIEAYWTDHKLMPALPSALYFLLSKLAL